MEKLSKILIAIIILLLFIIGMFVGGMLTMKMFDSYDVQTWKGACDDGCSIATRVNGTLTNETFSCWDKCDIYISDVVEGTR